MKNNIFDTALIFEGGGMRVAHSAGVTNAMLDCGLHFNYVCGVSAGSSNAVNYLSRDRERTKRSFVDFVEMDDVIGLRHWIKGEGYFTAEYLYGAASLPGGPLPLDFTRFQENPAELRIAAFDCETGETVYWKRKDIETIQDLLQMVRCSSTIPLMMPKAEFRGKIYVDGGIKDGIPLDIALRDGYEKFFIVLTREKGYRKKPSKIQRLLDCKFRDEPVLADSLHNRWVRYNKQMELIERLETQGAAIVVRPDRMRVRSTTSNRVKLEESYYDGYLLAMSNMDKWKIFLNI
ncbi:MAG: patatin family protein [Ruminococcaceae bacterium]|nr:patatin family protein [Oscillospiraceae bacterium]